MRIKAVVFDMDGLMFDTERLAQDIWLKFGADRGYPIDESFMARIRGRNSAAVQALVRETLGEDFPFDEAKKNCYDGIFLVMREKGLPVKAGLYQLLAYLKKEDYRIALATSTDRKRAAAYLDNAAVREYFDCIICGDMVTQSKPSPEIFLKAADTLKLPPASCLVLEDSPNGVLAAHRAGCPVVMIPDMDAPSCETASLTRKVAASLEDLPELLYLWRKEEI